MADDWNSFPEASQAKKDDWSSFPEVKATRAVREAKTSGQEQGLQDRMTIGSMEPDAAEAVKAAAWAAGDTALVNVPSFVTAAYQSYKNDTPLKEELAKQHAYTEALSRQHPVASGIGTAAGFGAGLLLPGAGAAMAVERAAAPVVGKTVAKLAGTGAVSGAYSGASSAFEHADMATAIRDAAVGAGVGAALQPIVGRIANKFIKEPGMIDEAGNITERGMKEIKAASGLADEDVIALKDKLAPIIKEKGFSPAAVKEAQLSEFGVEPTKSMVTGVKPTEAAIPEVEQRVKAGKEALATRAEELMAPAESRTATAEELQKAQRRRFEETQTKYEDAFSSEGEFGKGKRWVEKPLAEGEVREKPVFMQQEYGLNDLIMPEIAASLKAAQMPINLAASDRFDATKDALRYISRNVIGEKFLFGNTQDLKNMEGFRRELNAKFNKAADSEDKRALRAVIDGYDNALERALQEKLFSGANQEVLEKLRDARGYWQKFRNDFFAKEGAGGDALKATLKKMVDPQTKQVAETIDEGVAGAAQNVINRNFLKPGEGLSFYNRLEKAIGADHPAMEAVQANIRSLALDTKGDLTKLPNQINKLLAPENIELAKVAFGSRTDPAGAAQKLAELRRLAKAVDIINKNPTTAAEKQFSIIEMAKRVAPMAAGIVFGAPHGLTGQILGTAAAETAAAGARGIGQSRAVSKELAGAPKAVRPAATEIPIKTPYGDLTGTAPFVKNVPALYPDIEKDPNYEVPPLTIRPGRATGGRIAHPEAIANSLVSMADKAKKTINNDTEVLLKTPDTHVAQALEIANRQIEG
jgi:hypothetical protein